MQVTKDTVKHIAELARLNLSDEEIHKLTYQLSDILEYMQTLNSLDTQNIKPMEHIEDISNILREDKVEPSYDRDKILENAPDKEKGAFKAPKIVE